MASEFLDAAELVTPEKPPMSASPPRILIIGAGSRGTTYARCTTTSTNGIVVAVAEPHEFKRAQLGRAYIWGQDSPGEGSQFGDWRDFIAYEKQRRARAAAGEEGVPPGVDAAFVCVLDEQHHDVVVALARLGGLHIMCEKPLATRLADCVSMYRALRANRSDGGGEEMLFSIGHVLRYSPHNVTLRKLLLEDRVVGDILSVNHTEPVGWWHFAHSYVRGNWRREDTTAPSLLTKSCHDIDVLLWLLCSPARHVTEGGVEARPHLPSTVTSTGALQYFKRNRKPVAAGDATNCLSCPIERDCKYSARRIYLGGRPVGLGAGNTGWPISIVLPEIEELGATDAGRARLAATLAEDYPPGTPDAEVKRRSWFGRCVYESDNDVCDDEVVTVTWEDDPLAPGTPSSFSPTADSLRGRGAKQATFHMVAQTKKQCDRYTYVYGVDGELYADSRTITIEDFRTGQTITHRPKLESLGHGGGDVGLTRQFVAAVDNVKNHGWSHDRAQKEVIGCTLEEVIRSHALVFCAEEARKAGRTLDWQAWWAREVEGKLDDA